MLETILAAVVAAAAAAAATFWAVSRAQSLSRDDMRRLAEEIFNANSRQFRADSEQRIGELLDPIRRDFTRLETAITESFSREARERYSLKEQIRSLIDLNDTIGREARQLTSALKGNTLVQGQWGEMILRTILEKSGLRPGEEFTMQEAAASVDGDRLRADAVVTYPDGRRIVIDSKVSIKAYLEMAEAADPAARSALARRHVDSVRRHINELRDKSYQDYIGDARADFVLMFIPNEGAYMAAMQTDPRLWEYAYDCRVVIVSPTHLMSVLKLVEQTWQTDRQNANAREIALEGGRLIDKLAAFLSDMDRISSSIDTTRRAYDAALTKLNGRGGIRSKAETLRRLGAKSTRPLPPLPDTEENP